MLDRMKSFVSVIALSSAILLSTFDAGHAQGQQSCNPNFAGAQPQQSCDWSNPPLTLLPQGTTAASNSGGTPQTVPIGSVAYGSFGNATTLTSAEVYVSSIFVPFDMTVTNVNILNGGTVGTNSCIAVLYNTAGTVLRTSALAGATTSGANAFQAYALTSTIAIQGPGRYFVGLQCNGTTDNFRSIAASTFIGIVTQGNTGGVFGTIPAITPPTTFTANLGPVAFLN